jgi:hypothetical protein
MSKYRVNHHLDPAEDDYAEDEDSSPFNTSIVVWDEKLAGMTGTDEQPIILVNSCVVNV